MDEFSLEELVFDASKCSKLSMEQKIDLVYEVAKLSDDGTEMLQSWSRQEIVQILCAELGKERKYTGLTKSRLIEHLLQTVYEKRSKEHGTPNVSETQPSSENGERTSKRQRKSDQPNRLPTAATNASAFCKNSACKAQMNPKDEFCKRCACCICRKYDDNKDPSLWLICNSEAPFYGPSCGISCHLECALRHENSGISNDRQDKGLDGSFCCVSCGKVNDLLSPWRKQLMVARDTRRVDILCYRLSLGQKILAGTKHYQNLYGIIDEAVKKLEEDVGPLTGLPVTKARGIVNRLSSGPEIQRLCASALDSLDSMLSNRVFDTPSDHNTIPANLVSFEDIRASSLTVVLNVDALNSGKILSYALWHRKANDMDYPREPSCRLFPPSLKFLLSGLAPATQYLLRVVIYNTGRDMGSHEFQFQTKNYPTEALNLNCKSLEVESSQSPATTNHSSLSNPSSMEDETNNATISNEVDNRADNYLPFCGDATTKTTSARDTTNCLAQIHKEKNGSAASVVDEEHRVEPKSDTLMVEETITDNCIRTGWECVPYVGRQQSGLPITPCKLENLKDSNGRNTRTKLNGKGIVVAPKRDNETHAGSSSKKRSKERQTEESDEMAEKHFEYYVKVLRRLECDGHIETSFREKFLTWYSLRATPQELRVVRVFIDTFVDDPESLAGQLLHTFSNAVLNKKCCTVPAGFCSKLWH